MGRARRRPSASRPGRPQSRQSPAGSARTRPGAPHGSSGSGSVPPPGRWAVPGPATLAAGLCSRLPAPGSEGGRARAVAHGLGMPPARRPAPAVPCPCSGSPAGHRRLGPSPPGIPAQRLPLGAPGCPWAAAAPSAPHKRLQPQCVQQEGPKAPACSWDSMALSTSERRPQKPLRYLTRDSSAVHTLGEIPNPLHASQVTQNYPHELRGSGPAHLRRDPKTSSCASGETPAPRMPEEEPQAPASLSPLHASIPHPCLRGISAPCMPSRGLQSPVHLMEIPNPLHASYRIPIPLHYIRGTPVPSIPQREPHKRRQLPVHLTGDSKAPTCLSGNPSPATLSVLTWKSSVVVAVFLCLLALLISSIGPTAVALPHQGPCPDEQTPCSTLDW